MFWPLAAGGTILDLWSKRAVFEWLGDKWPPVYDVVPNFIRMVMAENPGAAFSIAQGRRVFLVGISIAALVVVMYVFFAGKMKGTVLKIALALLTAGICGNLYDRVFNRGLVRDFIDVYYRNWHWPAFNVADSMLCIAVGLIIVHSIVQGAREQKSNIKLQNKS